MALEGVVVGGDLNVAVGDLDFFNPDEARMEKQAGTTPEERASMRTTLGGLRDAFRLRHPAARCDQYEKAPRATGRSTAASASTTS